MVSVINTLLATLPHKQSRQLRFACEPIRLVLGEKLFEPGQTTEYVYFPTDSIVSLIAKTDDHPGVEVGMIGNEGMLGAHLAQGIVTAPFQAIVQGSGSALRLSATVFAEELHRIPQFHRQVQRYLYVQMVQFATSAACQKFHQIGPRLARWLLMSQDRAHRDNFYVTHEFLGYMLGVRRVGITTAAIALQRSGLINYQRGELVVLDRVGLEAQACSCYAKDKQTYTSTLS